MARPANPNKEKIADLKTQIKDNTKLVRAGETAAKKNEKLAERLAKLTGDNVAAPKGAKTQKVSSKKDKVEKTEKVSKKDKKSKDSKNKLQVVKKRGRPRKTDEDEA